MKSIAVLFFTITLVIAFAISSGAGYLNEVKVIGPEKQAQGAVHNAAENIYIIGVSYEGGTLRVFKARPRADGAVFGLSVETEYRG